MRSRRLTRNGRTSVFQIRVPKALDPALTLAPIRITLGCVSNSQARRMADVLGGLARIEFARIENTPMNDATPADARRQVEDRLTLILPTLLGLGVLGQSRLSAALRQRAVVAATQHLEAGRLRSRQGH
ncbi:hypothetical protein [Methylobacterium symbioticum]|uniref:hypothetical protein n=1 Tax=Methylobacterium symbioticum TaxID=2584084 RepID=UPI00115755E2|nr:hypothetical protein [Methylobacterium symbioticum]